jgi:AcrR family transcriptional regulator
MTSSNGRNAPDGERSLLRVATRLFFEVGPETPVNRLCAEALVSKGGFYHHFPSKRDLLLRVLADAGTNRRLPTGHFLRLLSAARRDPDVRRLLARSDGPLRTGAASVVGEAQEYGDAIQALLGVAPLSARDRRAAS